MVRWLCQIKCSVGCAKSVDCAKLNVQLVVPNQMFSRLCQIKCSVDCAKLNVQIDCAKFKCSVDWAKLDVQLVVPNY